MSPLSKSEYVACQDFLNVHFLRNKKIVNILNFVQLRYVGLTY